MLMLLALATLAGDTLRAGSAPAALVIDGRASRAEYGAPTVAFASANGTTEAWLVRREGTRVLAVHVADSSRAWRDAIAVHLDPRGSATPGPDGDDIQWLVRRVLDSTEVQRGRHGKWDDPAGDPDWRLGRERTGEGWSILSADDADGWSVELVIDEGWFAGDDGQLPRLGISVYDAAVRTWWAWPAPPEGQRTAAAELRPAWWMPVAH